MHNSSLLNHFYQGIKLSIFTSLTFTVGVINFKPISAQVVSDHTTGTIINQNQNQFNITGGIVSADGANLFHSFAQFGLNAQQTANFLATPNLQNILGRVTGGDPSYINGLIQITGGNPHLFLMNPAGIIFGDNMVLNVPADFTATTATGIIFGNEYFRAVGDNNYLNLIGNPMGFIFQNNTAGSIINTGDLKVGENHNLSLIGGTVISTGNLGAKSGNLNILTVPGTSKVILSQPGQILSLEINLPTDQLGNPVNITPLDLPALLTGSEGKIETQGIGLDHNGNISLNSSPVLLNHGDLVLNRANSNNIYASATGNLISIASELSASNNLNLLAENIVYIRDSLANPVIIRSGKDLYIQGNQGIDILALNHLETTPFVSGGNLTFVSDGLISGDAHYSSGGNVSFLNLLGRGAALYSFYDPIIRALGDVTLSDYTGASLLIEATGSITAGNIVINAIDLAIADNYALILKAGTTVVGSSSGDAPSHSITAPPASPATITVGGIEVGKVFNGESYDYNGGIVTISAPGDIDTGNINVSSEESEGGSITITSISGNINTGDLNTSAIVYGADGQGLGGNIILTTTQGSIITGNLNASAFASGFYQSVASGGNITLTTTQGSIITGSLDTSAFAYTDSFNVTILNAQGGNVILKAGSVPPNDNITFGAIDTRAIVARGFSVNPTVSAIGGDVTVTATGGSVTGIGTIFDRMVFNEDIISGGNYTINSSAISAQVIFNGENFVPQFSSINNAGGNISIIHDGGATNAPFIVGSGGVNVNGTIGYITDGDTNITNNSFPVQPNGGTNSFGNIVSITSINTPPSLTANNSLGNISQGGSITFSYSGLNPTITDINVDNTTLVVESILTGAVLIVNGVVATVGTIIPPGATIEFIPPSDTLGEVVAFTIKASDGVSFSNLVNLNLTIDTLPIENPGTENPVTENPVIENPVTENPVRESPVIEETVLIGKTSPENISGNNENLNDNSIPIITMDQAATVLTEIEQATGVKPAVIYVTFSPSLTSALPTKQNQKAELLDQKEEITDRFAHIERINSQQFQNHLNLSQNANEINFKITPQNTDELELILVIPNKPPIRKRVNNITRRDVIPLAKLFQASVTSYRRPRDFLTPAQKLYQWFISPLETTLKEEEIKNLVFIMEPGLRSLPLSALHDGKQYLVENYSVGLMPTMSLTDTRFVDIKNLQVLAMGAQIFTDQNPLPSVPLEISFIEEIWGGQSFLDQDFTKDNLTQARNQTPYGILHLATHGEFLPGDLSNSYIQFSDRRLTLDQFRQLGLNNPPVELMVLSACRTALGDESAELGFAGLALQAGVKTALGSLWYVSDEGTLALMTNFYQQLKEAPIKAEALRQAQLAMIRGEVRLENGSLTGTGFRGGLPAVVSSNQDFTHPYYWSGFTMIGSPW